MCRFAATRTRRERAPTSGSASSSWATRSSLLAAVAAERARAAGAAIDSDYPVLPPSSPLAPPTPPSPPPADDSPLAGDLLLTFNGETLDAEAALDAAVLARYALGFEKDKGPIDAAALFKGALERLSVVATVGVTASAHATADNVTLIFDVAFHEAGELPAVPCTLQPRADAADQNRWERCLRLCVGIDRDAAPRAGARQHDLP